MPFSLGAVVKADFRPVWVTCTSHLCCSHWFPGPDLCSLHQAQAHLLPCATAAGFPPVALLLTTPPTSCHHLRKLGAVTILVPMLKMGNLSSARGSLNLPLPQSHSTVTQCPYVPCQHLTSPFLSWQEALSDPTKQAVPYPCSQLWQPLQPEPIIQPLAAYHGLGWGAFYSLQELRDCQVKDGCQGLRGHCGGCRRDPGGPGWRPEGIS